LEIVFKNIKNEVNMSALQSSAATSSSSSQESYVCSGSEIPSLPFTMELTKGTHSYKILISKSDELPSWAKATFMTSDIPSLPLTLTLSEGTQATSMASVVSGTHAVALSNIIRITAPDAGSETCKAVFETTVSVSTSYGDRIKQLYCHQDSTAEILRICDKLAQDDRADNPSWSKLAQLELEGAKKSDAEPTEKKEKTEPKKKSVRFSEDG
jgi:hypothetical protein